MTDVLAITLQGMHQDMAQLERISSNLANATTPAYKREVLAARSSASNAFAEAVDTLGAQRGPASATSRSDVIPSAQGLVLVQTDQRPGTFKSTGQKLDVALGHRGYFEVATENGVAYTRQGNWQIDARGRLTTAAGHPVMGTGGEIVLSRPAPYIDKNGQIFESTPTAGPRTPVARLKLVDFEDPQQMVRLGDGLLQTEQVPVAVADADTDLRQGFLENSNVNSMQEMVKMIETMRHFEAMQKVALSYDDMLGSAIRKLGELS